MTQVSTEDGTPTAARAGQPAPAAQPARAAQPSGPQTPRQPRRGLVLGAGGMIGAAWTVGALCAVQEATGWRPGAADVILGTSSGSVLGSLLAAGGDPETLRDHQRGIPITSGPLAGIDFDYETATGGALPPRPTARIGSPGLLRDAVRHPRDYPFLTMVSAVVPPGRGSMAPLGDMVRSLFDSDGHWPHGTPLRVIAVDYRSGRRVVFGDPDAPRAAVADAVLASCAIPGWFAPVEVNGGRYIDGGCWSATNADLIAGRALDEVYVLAPMAVRLNPTGRTEPGGRMAAAVREWRDRDRPHGVFAQLVSRYRRTVTRQMLHEARELRAAGTRVHLLAPTVDDLTVMGANMMDPSRRTDVLETALRTSRAALAAAAATLPSAAAGPAVAVEAD